MGIARICCELVDARGELAQEYGQPENEQGTLKGALSFAR